MLSRRQILFNPLHSAMGGKSQFLRLNDDEVAKIHKQTLQKIVEMRKRVLKNLHRRRDGVRFEFKAGDVCILELKKGEQLTDPQTGSKKLQLNNLIFKILQIRSGGTAAKVLNLHDGSTRTISNFL